MSESEFWVYDGAFGPVKQVMSEHATAVLLHHAGLDVEWKGGKTPMFDVIGGSGRYDAKNLVPLSPQGSEDNAGGTWLLPHRGEKRFVTSTTTRHGTKITRTHLAFTRIELRQRARVNADFLFQADFGANGYQVTAPFERIRVSAVTIDEANRHIKVAPARGMYVVFADEWLDEHLLGTISPEGEIVLGPAAALQT